MSADTAFPTVQEVAIRQAQEDLAYCLEMLKLSVTTLQQLDPLDHERHASTYAGLPEIGRRGRAAALMLAEAVRGVDPFQPPTAVPERLISRPPVAFVPDEDGPQVPDAVSPAFDPVPGFDMPLPD